MSQAEGLEGQGIWGQRSKVVMSEFRWFRQSGPLGAGSVIHMGDTPGTVSVNMDPLITPLEHVGDFV